MKFWGKRNLATMKTQKMKAQEAVKIHNLQSFITLTQEEKNNLAQLKMFKVFKWFLLSEILKQGGCFGYESLETGKFRQK